MSLLHLMCLLLVLTYTFVVAEHVVTIYLDTLHATDHLIAEICCCP
jgi:hypothetical protein